MRNTHVIILLIVSSVLLGSCKQSSDVVSNHWLQKRKYRKGFHLDLAKQKRQENTFELIGDMPSARTTKDSLNRIAQNSGLLQSSTIRKGPSSIIPRKTLTKPHLLRNIALNQPKHLSDISEEPPPSEIEYFKKNRRKMWGWIISTILTLISMFAGVILLFFSPFALGILIPTFLLLPIAVALAAVYIVEHLAIRNGSQFLTEERKGKLQKRGDYWLKVLKSTSAIIALIFIVAFVISVKSGTIDALMLLLIGSILLVYLPAYWISIVSQTLTYKPSYKARSKLVQTIFAPLLLTFVIAILGAMVLFIFSSIV